MRFITLSLFLINITCAGQVVQSFSLTNIYDDKSVSLTDFSSRTGIAIIFTSTDCPYDQYYLNRIQKLIEKYQSQITVLLINSNQDESIDQMKKYVIQNNIKVPYLSDNQQKAMVSLGARKSPECFLLQPSGEKFIVFYKGAIDDNAQTASAVNMTYLAEAIDKLLAKQKIGTVEIRPVGCSLQKN
jgi:peroxiredoxin